MPKIPIKAKQTSVKLAAIPAKKPIAAIKIPQKSKSVSKTPKKIVIKPKDKVSDKSVDQQSLVQSILKKAVEHNKPKAEKSEAPVEAPTKDDSLPTSDNHEENLSQKEVKSAL